MTNKELQQNALAISEIIAQSGVSSEEFQKTDIGGLAEACYN